MWPSSDPENRWQVWVQYVSSRLRALSSHRLSVWLFLGVSVSLFFTILFIALPSARIRIWPKMTIVNHTANVLLTVSGATIKQDRQYVLPLLPIESNVSLTLTFDQISKNFLGENAKVLMTLINESEEPYTFRAGTRLVNQAGMIFRTRDSVTVPASSLSGPGSIEVVAKAQPEDLYGQIVGERGNVPEGLKWEIPGLSLDERKLVYARNVEPATGGTTKYGTLLKESDLALARKQLEQELTKAAKARTEEEIELLQAQTGEFYVVLQYDVLTGISFSGAALPLELVGKSVTSLPIEGALRYTVLAYSKDDLLELLLPGLMDHIEEGQELVEGSVLREGIAVHVVEYDDNFQWVKVTAELTGKQRANLSASSPAGRIFADKVREAIRGKTIQEAERIIQNFPEVDRVEVSMWPPWQRSLPSLSSNIFLLPQEK
jgi:hypothetical protein